MVHVAVIGAAGGIGQPLSLLLKTQLPEGSILSLYDVVGAAGVAADLSHIDTSVTVQFASGTPSLQNDPALTRIAQQNVDLFIIVAGMARQPGMTRQDLFQINAGILLNIVQTCAAVNPTALFAIATNPVNSNIPIAAEALKKIGVYNNNKLFGITTLDVMRATTFVKEAKHKSHQPIWPDDVSLVPVVGGHSDVTIVPLLSQLSSTTTITVPSLPLEQDHGVVVQQITKRVQTAGTEVVNAKAGKGSATLSMAAAAARFALHIVEAMLGHATPVQYSYVDTDGTHACAYFAIPVRLGPEGIQERLAIGPISEYEQGLLEEATKIVQKDIDAGNTFVQSKL